MANFFRCRIGIIQRSSGNSAIARAAYQACIRLTAPDGAVYDFTSNRGSHGHTRTIICAPPGSPAWTFDPQQLWTRAVLAEKRCNSQEARTLEISLPRELPLRLHEACVRYLVAPFIDAGMIAQADLHSVTACDGLPNDHVHLEMTLRRVERGEFSRRKSRDWNAMFYGQAKQVRTQIATRLNEFCNRHNVNYHADPRANAARGLPAPELTLPRWNVLLAKRTGERTPWLQENDAQRTTRTQIAQLEAELQQTERAIQIEQEHIAIDEQRRVAEIVPRPERLEKLERQELLPERERSENFEGLQGTPPDLSPEYSEPLPMPP